MTTEPTATLDATISCSHQLDRLATPSPSLLAAVHGSTMAIAGEVHLGDEDGDVVAVQVFNTKRSSPN